MNYKYEIVSVDTVNKCMEVLYTSDKHGSVTVVARLPFVDEDLESVIQMFSPARAWEEQDAPTIDVTVGTSGAVSPYVKTAADILAEQVVEIEQTRDTEATMPVLVHGRLWDADPRSQELLMQAITLANVGAPLPAIWRDHHNDGYHLSSVQELVAIAAAIATQTEQAYVRSWSKKAALVAPPPAQ